MPCSANFFTSMSRSHRRTRVLDPARNWPHCSNTQNSRFTKSLKGTRKEF
jgi:hypothetical protein